MQKKILSGIIIVLTLCSFCIAEGASRQFEYVGTKTCAMCHKTAAIGNQYGIWKKSKHANAYHVLQTKAATETAKKKGYTKKATEIAFCMNCHVSGFGVDKSTLGNKFDIEDGVQCETCHGPGSEYISVMDDREKAVKKGLIMPKDPEKLCKRCHNEQSPAYHGFNFKKLWEQIKHNIPGKK